MSDMHHLARDIASIVPGSTGAGIALRELHELAVVVKQQAADTLKQIEAALVEHIEATGEQIPCGLGRYWYVGTKTKVTCKDDQAVVAAVLDARGGDMSILASGENGVLGSSPWKHGAVKALLGPEEFERLFTTEYLVDLKDGAAKGVRALKVADERYSAARASFPKPPQQET